MKKAFIPLKRDSAKGIFGAVVRKSFRGFTLIEMVVVLLIIGILMVATMRFGSFRIDDLKSQSLKENFVGRYNALYAQNMASSFRNGKKYTHLSLSFTTGISLAVDDVPVPSDPALSDIEIRDIYLDQDDSFPLSSASIARRPYILGCTILDAQSHS